MNEDFLKSTFPASLQQVTSLLQSTRSYQEFSVLYEKIISNPNETSLSFPPQSKMDFSKFLSSPQYFLLELKFWELLLSHAKIEVSSTLPKLHAKKNRLFLLIDNFRGIMRESLMEEVIKNLGGGNAITLSLIIEDSLSLNVIRNSLKLRSRNSGFIKIAVNKREFGRMLESLNKFELRGLVWLYCQEKNGGEIPFL
jgi:hypothetical protein